MAKVIFAEPVEMQSGKLKRSSNVYFRVVNGKKFAVMMENPRTGDRASEHEKMYRKRVGELSKEASRINKDETQAAAYNDWKERGYTSRYRCILGELIRGQRPPDDAWMTPAQPHAMLC